MTIFGPCHSWIQWAIWYFYVGFISCKWFCPSVCPSYCLLIPLPHACHMPCPSFLHLMPGMIFGELYNSPRSSLCSFVLSRVSSFRIGPSTVLRTALRAFCTYSLLGPQSCSWERVADGQQQSAVAQYRRCVSHTGSTISTFNMLAFLNSNDVALSRPADTGVSVCHVDLRLRMCG